MERFQSRNEKDQPGGYAGVGDDGLIPPALYVSSSGTAVNDRRWVRGSTAHAQDDEFNDDSLDGAWTRVDKSGGSGRATWAEGGDSLSLVLAGGDSAAEMHGLVKSYALAVGESIQCHITWSGPQSTYPFAGLVVADGATHGSGIQMFWSLWNAGGDLNAQDGYWTGWDTRSAFTDRNTDTSWGPTSNVWRFYVSSDAVQWLEIASRTQAMTPSHVGFAGGTWTGSQYMFSFDYFRVV